MAAALSIDLRVRVLAAVSAGLSHRAAGERFGVSAASVSRWRALEREQGDVRSRGLGGDRRSHVIKACKDRILAVLEEKPDVTIEELRRALAEQGHLFGDGAIRRFFKRHASTRKKRPRTPASRIAPTS